MLSFQTTGPGLVEITRNVEDWLAGQHPGQGLLTLMCQHTSASLTVQENADPDVALDLQDGLDRLAPREAPYRHRSEGPDDMPSHIRTVLSGIHLSIPVIGGRMCLGTWQGIWLWEHRDRGRERRIALHLLSD